MLPTRWLRVLCNGLLLAGLLLVPGSAGAAGNRFQFTPGEVVVFQESGAGHGVGMSQWGARGRALAGEAAPQILAAYYQGTTLGSQGSDQDPIRVLLPTDQVIALPFSRYLASVVSSELPAHWPVAAVQAQAIASRTYARWNLTPDRPFDVTSTVQSQVYGAPARAEAAAAVAATADQVVTDGGKVIPAFFHACSPTWTANNDTVWSGAPLPFLRAIHDVAPDGQPYAQGCPYAHIQAGPFSTEALSRLLAADPRSAVGNLQTLVYGSRDQGGRLATVTLIGDAGAKTVSGDAFRAIISAGQPLTRSLLSADFRVAVAPPGTSVSPVAPLPPVVHGTSPVAPPPATPVPPTVVSTWVVTSRVGVPLWSAPHAVAPVITILPIGAPLLALAAPAGPWLYVRDPANGRLAYVDGASVLAWHPGSTPPASGAPAVLPAPGLAAPTFQPYWVETFAPTRLWSGVDAQAISFGPLRQWTLLQVFAPAVNGRYLVRVWSTGGMAYVDGAVVGPAGAPATTGAILAPPRSSFARPVTYTVQPGDTLFAIARRFGVSAPALAAANNLTNRDHVVPGQRLELPGGSGRPGLG